MSPSYRRLGVAVVGLALFGVLGCGEDNEKEAKITSTAPPPGSAPPPRSVEEYAKRSGGQKPGAYGGGSGYPGKAGR